MLPFKKLQFGSFLYSFGVTVNYYCGSDLVLTPDAVFVHKTVYWSAVTQLHSTTKCVSFKFLLFVWGVGGGGGGGGKK